MKVLLTGATGFIGGHTARLLVAQGHQVVCLVRRTSNLSRLKSLGVSFSYGDITQPTTVSSALDGADAVLHLAAWYEFGIDDKKRMHRINVEGTRNVLQAATDAEVKRILYCSTIAALGPTGPQPANEEHPHPGVFRSAYEETKRLAHLEMDKLRTKGFPIVTVLPGAVFGPNDTSIVGGMIEAFLNRRTPVLLCPDFRNSYVFVEDVADGIVKALEKGKNGEDYILVESVLSNDEIYEKLSSLTGIPKPKYRVSGFMAQVAVFLEGLRAQMTETKPLITKEGFQMIASSHWAYDGKKARQDLGWSPRAFDEAFKLTVESIQARKKPEPAS